MIPYEPVIRHEPAHTGAALCDRCRYGFQNRTCPGPDCDCVCRTPTEEPPEGLTGVFHLDFHGEPGEGIEAFPDGAIHELIVPAPPPRNNPRVALAFWLGLSVGVAAVCLGVVVDWNPWLRAILAVLTVVGGMAITGRMMEEK